MKTAILSVGTELLFGQILNTNTVFLSQQLNLLGYDVMYHYTVGDNPRRLGEIIEHIFQDCDLIITTGGLGPTQDDLTKETVCEILKDKLVLNEQEMEDIESYFDKMKRTMTENNRKQAYFPSRAEIFKNDAGTASGFALEYQGKTVICMPGPPREMTRMYEKKVKPYLEAKQDSVIYYKMVRTFGIGESSLETEILDLIDGQTDPTLATYAKEGECTLRIASKRKTKEEAEEAVNEMLDKVKERIGKYIYSCDDENLWNVVGKKLIEKKISISCAESCTGGMFAETLTGIPRISAVFDRGLVTYSNEAKMDELGVEKRVLDEFGAVSEETALAMAKGLRKRTGSDICISVTGIAGPGGGTETKPVGLVYVAAAYSGALANGDSQEEKHLVKRINMRNVNREWNRRYSVLYMLDIVNKIVDGRI